MSPLESAEGREWWPGSDRLCKHHGLFFLEIPPFFVEERMPDALLSRLELTGPRDHCRLIVIDTRRKVPVR